ncbi:MAG: M48 family metalloprotease [Gammaproteobacteria bacterium]
MDVAYPAGPDSVPENLTRPTRAYRYHAWLAMGGLALFVALYFLLAGWFVGTAYRLLTGAANAGDDMLWALIGGSCAAFLAVFMLKALFFVKHGQESDDIEITAGEQPRLFAFLHRLADDAGAPRPHRVFLSPRVNAAVFYDLSILNLIVPSKKNLEIGLGLVNALTLAELKAVLAHEFGHFAQRTMAVGRWVYIAQQIAAHLIAQRDALDRFLQRLSRWDVRIAWIGWVLSLVVWSIRSLTEIMFRGVVALQRALSREMELQADLVAVSLTGSDALIHALHRLHVADEAWERALGFFGAELQAGRAVKDIFAIQSRLTEQMRTVLGRPDYGQVPPLPRDGREAHRLFKAGIAQPPRMWATHPENTERESNAKRRYIAAPLDDRSALELFDDVPGLKEKISARLARNAAAQAVPIEESLAKLDAQYERAYLNRAYRGTYLSRSVVRDVEQPSKLYGIAPPPASVASELATLYPESLTGELARLRELQDERASLQALSDGVLTAPGKITRDLPRRIAVISAEIDAVAKRVADHDRRCRTAHLAAAAMVKSGWEEYLRALASVLHYADHTEANVRDAQGYLANVFAVATVDRRVSAREVRRLIEAAGELHGVLAGVHAGSQDVMLDRTLTRRMHVEGWTQALGKFELPPPTRENISKWLDAVDGWVESIAGPLAALRLAALEQLLLAESQLARFVCQRMRAGPAPPPSRVPATYPLLLPGTERKRQTRLGWWDRFQTAEGAVATSARLAIALAIVGAVFMVGGAADHSTVTIYNGLGRAVSVSIGDATTQLEPFSFTRLAVSEGERYRIETRTTDGKPIEAFDGEGKGSFAHLVYNVASASPLVEWTATYGDAAPSPERQLGAPRWTSSSADVLFEKPPDVVNTKGDGGTRRVLTGIGNGSPDQLLPLVASDEERWRLVATHARWDATSSKHAWYWLGLASTQDDFADILAARFAESPYDALLLRVEQDTAGEVERAAICERHRALAAKASDVPDLQYAATRCVEDAGAKDQTFLDLNRRWPDNGWLALAAGYTFTQNEQWSEAMPRFELALKSVPALAEMMGLEVARLRRVLGTGKSAAFADLLSHSEQLFHYLSLESGQGLEENHPLIAYRELAEGKLDAAVRRVSASQPDMPRLLRLAAASDGASPALAEQALALTPDQGIDPDTVWAAIALAARYKRDVTPYIDIAKRSASGDAAGAVAFIEFIRSSARLDPAAAEKMLDHVLPETRGHAYSAAVVLLGENAPAKWREMAKRLLFSAERPFFR